MPSNPRAAVIDYLLTDPRVSAIVGDRVWPELEEEEAQKMARACVIVTESGGGTGPGARSYAEWDKTRMDITCYGEKSLEASTLHRTVQRSLKQMTRNIKKNTVLVDATLSAGPVSGRDSDAPSWPLVWASYLVSSLEED